MVVFGLVKYVIQIMDFVFSSTRHILKITGTKSFVRVLHFATKINFITKFVSSFLILRVLSYNNIEICR